jgi:hypothetical protein
VCTLLEGIPGGFGEDIGISVTTAIAVSVPFTMAFTSGVGLACPPGWKVQNIEVSESAANTKIIFLFMPSPLLFLPLEFTATSATCLI